MKRCINLRPLRSFCNTSSVPGVRLDLSNPDISSREKRKRTSYMLSDDYAEHSRGISQAELSSSLNRLRRFYKTASMHPLDPIEHAEEIEEDAVDLPVKFGVQLDLRTVKTPKKFTFYAPSESLALGVVEEWAKQGRVINSFSMPLMTMCTSTIDKILHGRKGLRGDLVRQQVNFMTSDQVTYFAMDEPDLLRLQESLLVPVIEWFEREMHVKLVRNEHVVAAEQPIAAINQVHELLDSCSAWELAAVDAVTSTTKSIVLAIAVLKQAISCDSLTRLGFLDEMYQMGRYGVVEGGHDVPLTDLVKLCSSACTLVDLLPQEARGIKPSSRQIQLDTSQQKWAFDF